MSTTWWRRLWVTSGMGRIAMKTLACVETTAICEGFPRARAAAVHVLRYAGHQIVDQEQV